MKNRITNADLVGFAVCRFGGIVHQHDGDSMRANRVSDGTVFCVFCGRRGPSTIDALINANGEGRGRLVQVDDPHYYRYTVTLSPNAWASISFEDPKLFDDPKIFDVNGENEPGTEFGKEYVTPRPEAKFPEAVDKLAKALANIGFRVTGDQATNVQGSMIMVLGRRLFPGDPERGALSGVRVELSWVY
jgi:hypothetical protein